MLDKFVLSRDGVVLSLRRYLREGIDNRQDTDHGNATTLPQRANLANIIDASLDALAGIIADENAIRSLLYGGAD